MSKFLSREPFRYSILPYMVTAVENKLSEALGISLLLPAYKNFMLKLQHLSLRDLKKLITLNTLDRMLSNVLCYNQLQFATSLPIFQLMIYMVECGMTMEEIAQDLAFSSNSYKSDNKSTYELQYVSLMFPIYKMMYEDKHSICIDNINYYVMGDFSKLISNIKVERYSSWDQSSIPLLKVKNFTTSLLLLKKSLSKSINFSALNQ